MNMALIPSVVRIVIHLYNDSIACDFKKLSDTAYFAQWLYLPIRTLGRFSAKPGTGKL
jgi:hypothetical protein